MRKPQKIEFLRHLDFKKISAFWLIFIGYLFVPQGISQLAEKEDSHLHAGGYAFLTMGLVCLALGMYLAYGIYRHYRSAKEWGGQYYEFNDIHLRVSTTVRGELVFNFSDLVDALEIRDNADRARLLAGFRQQRQIYGDDTSDVYITKQGVWDFLARKSGRLAIQFRAYLQQIPEFRLPTESDLTQ